ncbi:ubiquitin carboxyl-terminal hydrolase 2 [Morus notabilis]|uniref:ubiquitin carboxyl-terminal hydrolase 2 n=1 Tax=Morus notabilis TaxID=981085 RepID=UPI000CED6174|nr:ubiquitin carboxyl-terminal hydrolase 2 [Morus notabilis]XP_024028855.1 ubiquitin carboxyl-terminal hydrolase 2 [Morus notabilis]
MGKKVKKKSRTPQKEKRAAAISQKNVSEPSSRSVEMVDNLVSEAKEKKSCPHLDKGVDLEALSAKIGSSEHDRCEDCREGAADRRGGRGKGKHGKKKGGGSAELESKAIWVCLKCGHFACGGVGLPTDSQCHAIRHTRLTRHPLVIQLEKPQLRWCFPCNTLVQAKKTEENGGQKDAFSEVVKLIKGRTSEGSAVNVEDVGFGSGSVTTEIKSAAAVAIDWDGQGGYVASGLVNLGNTCFFNSVVQNLLAMDKLRDYFFKSDVSVGPLTMALKKLFVETKPDAGSKSVINPRAVFGCVSSKAPQFRGYQQHDSHELLRCLLDGLSSEELGMKKQMNSSKENGNSSSLGPTFVDAVFGGQVASTVRCVQCGHSSTVYEPFLDLSLPVPTKKPTSKKSQQASWEKKAKVPRKRGGKTRPKLNRSIESAAVASPIKELSCEPQSSSTGPTTVAEENGSVVHNPAPVEETKNKQVSEDAAEQTSALLDDFTWLNYLEPEAPFGDYSSTAIDAAESIIQDVEGEDILKNDVHVPESNEQVLPLNEEPDIKHQFSTVDPWEDEIPLQVQSSEVLLLPYKEEENSAFVEFGEGEASSSIHGVGQEDFDGFGGLFDEPEVSTGPIVGPSMANEIAETGFMAGNSSESDLDEVDDTDSPVSVETCLAHFTKPELLSNENSWHCENCSKKVLRQKLRDNKQSKAAAKTLVNGCGTRTQSDIGNSNKDPCPTEVSNTNNNFQSVADSNKFDAAMNCSIKNHTAEENGQQDKIDPFVPQGEEGIAKKDAAQEQSNSSGSYYTCRQESLSDQAIDSSCADEPSSAGAISESVQQGESKLLPKNGELEESGDDEIYSETVKVKRDATKRVLINKAPPVLTIHLKRFSQDARGRLSKLNGHVTFKETIDLKPYMDARCIDEESSYVYRLVGIVEHSGTMRMGHYVAYVRGGDRNGMKDGGSTWFHASDAYVRETNLKEVLGCEAYILFYEKV